MAVGCSTRFKGGLVGLGVRGSLISEGGEVPDLKMVGVGLEKCNPRAGTRG